MFDDIHALAITSAILANLGIVNEGDTLEIDFGAGHMFSDENDHLIGDDYMLAIIGGILTIATIWAVGRFALSSTKEAKQPTEIFEEIEEILDAVEELPKPEEESMDSIAEEIIETVMEETPKPEENSLASSPGEPIFKSTPNEETAAIKDSPKGKIKRETTIFLIKKTYSPKK